MHAHVLYTACFSKLLRSDDSIFGDGDPLSTNLFVSNIHPSVTELGLCQEFGKYGPIASVKIMWPRTQDEKDKGRNNGFVCFMKRSDAAEAIKNLNGIELEGFKLRVGWGKAVALPAEPVFGMFINESHMYMLMFVTQCWKRQQRPPRQDFLLMHR